MLFLSLSHSSPIGSWNNIVVVIIPLIPLMVIIKITWNGTLEYSTPSSVWSCIESRYPYKKEQTSGFSTQASTGAYPNTSKPMPTLITLKFLLWQNEIPLSPYLHITKHLLNIIRIMKHTKKIHCSSNLHYD